MLHHQVCTGVITGTIVIRVDEVPGEVHAVTDVVGAATPRPVLHLAILAVFPPFALGTPALDDLAAATRPGDMEGDAGWRHPLYECHLWVSCMVKKIWRWWNIWR